MIENEWWYKMSIILFIILSIILFMVLSIITCKKFSYFLF